MNHKADYFEVEKPLLGRAVCSDAECPCPETKLECGSGYLWVSKELVNFRRKLRTSAEVKKRFQGRPMFFGPGVAAPIAMCEEAARRRGLHLETAAADFTHWWKTGLVPQRPTPLASSTSTGSVASEPASVWGQLWEEYKEAPIVVKVLAVIGLLVILVPLLGCLMLPLAALLGK